MKFSYDDILSKMRNKFYEACGHNPIALDDVDARLQAVASELYSLALFEDYSLKQSFVQTATGEYLDKHAELRNTKRKQAKKSKVSLTFSIPEPLEEKLVIPAGVICSCSGKAYIQFKTTTNGTIAIGSKSCTVSAESVGSGSEYNVGANQICVMVNAPVGVGSVNNSNSATGGTDLETDEHLRARLLKLYSVPSSGLSLTSMESVVEALDDVIECRAIKENDTITFYARTATDTISTALSTKIKSSVDIVQLMRYALQVSPAIKKSVSIKVKLKLENPNDESVKEKALAYIKEHLEANQIGKSIDLGELNISCKEIDGVELAAITCNGSGIIVLANNEYISVSGMELSLI